jgi:uncharacterized protein
MSLSTTQTPATIHITTDAITEPFWIAAKEGRLTAPKCTSCGTFRFPPTPFCPSCQKQSVDFVEITGATIFSYSIVRGLATQPDDVIVPIIVAFANAPGVHVVSNLVDADPETVAIGQALTLDFITIADDWKLPIFRVAK